MRSFDDDLKHQVFQLPINCHLTIDSKKGINHCKNLGNNNDFEICNDNKKLCPNKQNSSSAISVSNNKRTKFSPKEDDILMREIAVNGPRKWDVIALSLPGRNGRQCRDRFQNYLNPSLINGPWTKEEDILLEQKFNEVGPHWNSISKYFNGRSSNNVKNRWYTYFNKKNNNKSQSASNKNINDEDEEFEYHKIDDNNSNNKNDLMVDKYGNHIMKNNSSFNCVDDCNRSYIGFDNNEYSIESSKKSNIDILIQKPKGFRKVLFPPIYPPNESFVSPLNLGLFDFLNREII